MPLNVDLNESFECSTGRQSCFKLYYIKQGRGLFNVHGKKVLGIAPILICLDETENIFLHENEGLVTWSVYFQPAIINSVFTLDFVRNNDSAIMNTSTYQDLSLIDPFIDRNRSMMTNIVKVGADVVKRLNALFMDLYSELTEQVSEDSWPCSSRSYFLEILFLVGRVSKKSSNINAQMIMDERSGKELDMESLLIFLHTNYMKKLTVNDIAREFCTNRTTLSGHFKKSTGMAVISYLIKIRIDMACMMLRNTELSIAEIVERTGFNDMTHFGRMFKRITAFSPSEYRGKYCWMLKK